MQALDFCEECEVYHRLVREGNQFVFTDCQRKINENLPEECIQMASKKINFNHQDSPTSKASFISIQNHLTPIANKESNFKSSNLSPKTLSQNVQPHLQIQNNFIIPPRPYIPQALPIPQINILPVERKAPLRMVVSPQKQVVQVPINLNVPFPKSQSKSLLSTIKEEKYDDSQASKSLYAASVYSGQTSKRSSFDNRMPPSIKEIKPELVNKFEELKNNKDEVIPKEFQYKFKSLKKKYEIDLKNNEQKQKICWCW